MKKTKKKKSKPKKKWSKQVGHFLFKHAFQKAGGLILVDVFFKEELIGILFCTSMSHRHKSSYPLSIHRIGDKMGQSLIGTAECYGMVHGLPKTIKNVTLKNETTLTLKRKVLIEKCKTIELGILFSPGAIGIPIRGLALPPRAEDQMTIQQLQQQ